MINLKIVRYDESHLNYVAGELHAHGLKLIPASHPRAVCVQVERRSEGSALTAALQVYTLKTGDFFVSFYNRGCAFMNDEECFTLCSVLTTHEPAFTLTGDECDTVFNCTIDDALFAALMRPVLATKFFELVPSPAATHPTMTEIQAMADDRLDPGTFMQEGFTPTPAMEEAVKKAFAAENGPQVLPLDYTKSDYTQAAAQVRETIVHAREDATEAARQLEKTLKGGFRTFEPTDTGTERADAVTKALKRKNELEEADRIGYMRGFREADSRAKPEMEAAVRQAYDKGNKDGHRQGWYNALANMRHRIEKLFDAEEAASKIDDPEAAKKEE